MPQAKRNPPPKAPPKPWGWLIAGMFLGGFLVFMLYVGGILPNPDRDPAKQQASRPDQPESSKPAPKSHFDFYTLLPENEVIAPDVPEYDPNDPEAASGTRYMLQAGSFRRFADADRLRARLILMGLDALIEKVSIASGESWHRVQLGPYASRKDANRVKQQLAKQRIETMVLKRRATD